LCVIASIFIHDFPFIFISFHVSLLRNAQANLWSIMFFFAWESLLSAPMLLLLRKVSIQFCESRSQLDDREIEITPSELAFFSRLSVKVHFGENFLPGNVGSMRKKKIIESQPKGIT
jgi:hypothetical protein